MINIPHSNYFTSYSPILKYSSDFKQNNQIALKNNS